MTLDEFLDQVLPQIRDLGWEVRPSGAIRVVGKSRCCPLIAAVPDQTFGAIAGLRIGLTSGVVSRIMWAADHRSDSWGIRARLLAGLGLSEPGGERGSR